MPTSKDIPLDVCIRQIFEKQQVIFVVLKNVQVEIQSLRLEVTAVTSLFLKLLDDPETNQHAAAILRDHNFNKNK